MIKNRLLILIFLYISILSNAQNNIKSIQLRGIENGDFSAIVPLGKTLELSFDDLNVDQKEYSYKIEHMTYDWKPSDLFSSEYISGFQEDRISNMENSFNTFQNYTHYSIQIPNKSTRITKTGNYIISVLNDLQQVVFKRRFTLYQKKTTVGVSLQQKRNTFSNKHKLDVQFVINYNNNTIKNPSIEIEVAILQNEDWNTAITSIKPQYFKNNQLQYRYIDRTTFWSGNEYLNFDNKQLRASTIKIAQATKKSIYHSYLYQDDRRNEKFYTHNPDINGQFVVRNIEGFNPASEADYAWVHFTLASEEIHNKGIYVYGAFNNFSLHPENKMNYNKSNQNYEASLLLKQGFYNYTYVTKDQEGNLNLTELNGSFSQTENKYSVIVYYKAFGSRYYEAIGLGESYSNPQK